MDDKTKQLEKPETAMSEPQFNLTEDTASGSLTVSKDGEVPFTNFSIILGQLQRLDSAIHKEFTLVSDRMSWMVTSQSFIFTAFIIAVVNYKDELVFAYLTEFFLIFMPLLGIFLAAIVRGAIAAAHKAANRLKDDRDQLEVRLPGILRIKPVSSRDPENDTGNLPAIYVPYVIIGVWSVMLVVTILTMIFKLKFLTIRGSAI